MNWKEIQFLRIQKRSKGKKISIECELEIIEFYIVAKRQF